MNLKALSVVAPAGDWISKKKKSIEVRSWTPEITPLLDVAIVQNHNYLSKDCPEDKNGYIVAIVDFEKVEPWKKDQQQLALSNNWSPGYYGWHITNVRTISPPIKATAKLKIYDVYVDENLLHIKNLA